MFSKKYKIAQKKEFDLIYKKSTVFHSDYLTVFILPNNLDYSRFSIVVPKAVSSKAVERNKIKRRLRNIFINLNIPLNSPVDALVKTMPGIEKVQTNVLKEKLETLFTKIKDMKLKK
ncbi:MAG: Ribonuclease P protein component [Candidatus Moranbacteria bacterium GW2011_GWF2_34_56]|nr:MAG: Ribonuclease P protein component [Candidatus Moranbacteria bacterium GW2011_GWF1_34_10]KKP64284.1 MAG: Ribonuclease P protein component [Candidatus Moranbacteria bacterium GW2011_GWF2_34_56]HBI17376.1 ribonuclease P protein component [Candidatus Moranbacteria bacterium]